MISHFYIARYSFILTAIEKIILPPYKGSTFRGAFGKALKNSVCYIGLSNCNECPIKNRCAYIYLFETPPPKNTKMMKKYTSTPHPFILIPPLKGKNEYYPYEKINFELTLIGKAIDYLSFFITAVKRMGRFGIGKGRGKFELNEVWVNSLNGKNVKVYRKGEGMLSNVNHKIKFNEIINNYKDTNILNITFITPTRITFEGKYSNDIPFHLLFRTLLRRISLLSYFHLEKELSHIDFKGLINESKSIKTISYNLRYMDWERYSHRQKRHINMGGMVGDVTYQGELTKFFPFLVLGEYIHVGKGTVFGMGKYVIKNNK
ncbi:MAG: CRISPR system precrRNA processing endoribonuclease RAMP protein Cas6 [Deltaproteobacteria bacterium]|nr:CRISPR system precrRNA processing endoribonuclease RAMP protein Cas6 [Deltaproteobacteria bacterium]